MEIPFSQQDILKLRRDRVQPSLLGVSYPSLPYLLPAALYPPTLLPLPCSSEPSLPPLDLLPYLVFPVLSS